MHKSRTLLALTVTTLVLGSCLARNLPDSAETSKHRARRALGTMTLIQKELELALGRHLPHGCSVIGCEMLNPVLSGKKRRAFDVDAEDALQEDVDSARRIALLQDLLQRVMRTS